MSIIIFAASAIKNLFHVVRSPLAFHASKKRLIRPRQLLPVRNPRPVELEK
jgi:hypothetical protein